MTRYAFLFFGVVFGFLLSRAGATTYDFYAQLFLFENFQLMWVIGAAAGVGMIGVAFLRRSGARSLFGGEPLALEAKPYTPGTIPGSILFGIGWGLAGACPGTVLAMLGEGKLGALFTIAGIVVGVYLYGVQENAKLKRQTTVSTATSDARA